MKTIFKLKVEGVEYKLDLGDSAADISLKHRDSPKFITIDTKATLDVQGIKHYVDYIKYLTKYLKYEAYEPEYLSDLKNKFNIKFNLGQLVFLKTDKEQKERIIVEITICLNNSISYCLSQGENKSWHYDFEISKDKDILKLLI
jgi:hypothetical protein